MISRYSAARALPAAALALAMTGCIPEDSPGDGGDPQDGDEVLLETRDMPVRPVEWNPGGASVGKVGAVAERGSLTAVFSDAGAVLFQGGITTGTDAMVTDVTAAAAIPAGDHNGLWIAGADAGGKVLRLFSEQSFEVVSALYGLSEYKVTGLAALGETGTVFATGEALAISDGTTVTFYDTGALTGITGGAARAAGVGKDGVAVFDPSTGTLVSFELKGASAVAFDDDGKLLALSPEALYREDGDGALAVIYRSQDAGLAGLAAAPGRVWFADGTRLGVVDKTGVGLAPEGTLTGERTLTASPSGDVWVTTAGTLSRLAVDVGSEDGRHTWESEMQPIFSASCTPCHEPNGVAPVVLSTYDSWLGNQEELRKRVIEKKDMPPSGFELSDEDRAAIGAWLEAQSK